MQQMAKGNPPKEHTQPARHPCAREGRGARAGLNQPTDSNYHEHHPGPSVRVISDHPHTN